MFEAISSIIQENLKKLESLRKQLRAAIFKPSSDNGPFSFDNCYMVSQKQGFNDKDGLYAYVETRDEALRLFNALKSSSGGKTLQVFEISKDDEKIIKEN